MAECIFCEIINHKKPGIRLFENDKTLAILDIFPISRGHTLVIPKVHSRNLFDIKADDIAAIGITVSLVAKVLKQTLSCEGINVFQGNEKAAKQEIMHTHFHVLPRWFSDNVVFEAPREKLKEDPLFISKLKSGFLRKY